MIGSIIALVILILFSAYFSATETAFSTINKIRIKNMAENGSQKAALVLHFSEDYNKLLSTILVGNNIVNIAATAIATVLFVKIYGDIGATISTVIITIVVLIFGEISPKTLAKEAPEKFALFSAPILRVFMVILTPVNFLFGQWKKLLGKLFKHDDSQSITEEELLSLVTEAEHEGVIDEEDSDLIHSVIDFNDSRVEDILTPRVDIFALEKEAGEAETRKMFIETGFSRIPVYDDTIDNIIGVLHIRDFIKMEGKKIALEDIITPVVYVTPAMKINDLLKLLQEEKIHLAVVTDEFGSITGIVTMEDILEELIGEIWDEHDKVIEEFVTLPDGRIKVNCRVDMDEMSAVFNISGEFDYVTASGWVMECLGKIPEQGDSFDYENLHVTVTKTEHHRPLEIIVEVREIEQEEPALT